MTQTPAGGFAAGDLVQVTTSLYLRPTPEPAVARSRALPTGAVLLVTGQGQSASGHFYIPVAYNSLTGWVASDYVTKIGVATATPTMTTTPTRTPTFTPTSTSTPSLRTHGHAFRWL